MTTEEQYYDIYLGRVSGLSPFMGDTDLETMANVTIAEYDYEDEAFDNVSQAVKKRNFRQLTGCPKTKAGWDTRINNKIIHLGSCMPTSIHWHLVSLVDYNGDFQSIQISHLRSLGKIMSMPTRLTTSTK